MKFKLTVRSIQQYYDIDVEKERNIFRNNSLLILISQCFLNFDLFIIVKMKKLLKCLDVKSI